MQKTWNERVFDVAVYGLGGAIMLLMVYPLYFVLIASVSDATQVLAGKVVLWPKGLNVSAYQAVLENSKIWIGYRNTLLYTVLGTAVNMLLTTLGAYPLSRKDMPLRGTFTFVIAFTMMFSGGLIPTYLVVKSLNIPDTIWAMIIPSAIATYNLLVMRAYFQNSIPYEMTESAAIDGCSDMKMLVKIILPLAVPILAVVTLFYAVGHWNAFFNALIYLRKQHLFPLQIILREILLMNTLDFANDSAGMYEKVMQGEAMKYAIILIASAPMLFLYPFVQKYFIKGIMVGALKG